MKRAALLRKTALKRGAWLRRRPAKKSIVEAAGEIWREGLGPCAVCPREGIVCIGPVQAHHCISKQALRRRGLLFETLDHRNRLAVCEYRHEQHTNGYKPIPRSALPESVFEFAKELDLEWYLDRFYPAAEKSVA